VSSYSFAGIDGDTKSFTKIWAVRDSNGDGVADFVGPVTGDLWVPNGIAIINGDLYVALIDQILRYRNVEHDLSVVGTPEVFLAAGTMPNSTWHGWRYMRAGPDGGLYLAIGSPCNVPCDQDCEYDVVGFSASCV
jgi:glucose/arabinose dehydrogenase